VLSLLLYRYECRVTLTTLSKLLTRSRRHEARIESKGLWRHHPAKAILRHSSNNMRTLSTLLMSAAVTAAGHTQPCKDHDTTERVQPTGRGVNEPLPLHTRLLLSQAPGILQRFHPPRRTAIVNKYIINPP
jgi:hypothetical protein